MNWGIGFTAGWMLLLVASGLADIAYQACCYVENPMHPF